MIFWDFSQNGRHGIIQIHHALSLQVLIALWCMSAAINGGVITDELTDICFYAVNLYAFGVIPVRDLNRREKCCGYSKPSW